MHKRNDAPHVIQQGASTARHTFPSCGSLSASSRIALSVSEPGAGRQREQAAAHHRTADLCEQLGLRRGRAGTGERGPGVRACTTTSTVHERMLVSAGSRAARGLDWRTFARTGAEISRLPSLPCHGPAAKAGACTWGEPQATGHRVCLVLCV